MNRLLALCTSPDQGGLELYFLNFIKHYEKRKGFYIACSKNSYVSKNVDIKIECETHGFFKNIRNLLRLRKFILKNEIDWIHVSWQKDILLGVLLKMLTPRDIKLVFYRQMKLTRHKKSIYHKFIYGKVDLYLVITKKLYNEACEYLPLNRSVIHILTYGICKPKTKLSISKKEFFNSQNMDSSLFTIGTFSRIEKQKGHHLVIEAINKSKHKTQLCIIGHCMNEKYKNELKDISSNYDMSNLISFTGFLESPMSYMPFFDLIILPTYEETFGLIVAEAMLMKVPVIGSNAGGVPEIITHKSNGLLFHSKNYNDLQEKIDIIIEDLELREKITANGFKFANKHYDYLSHFNKFEELINTH
tara:strand:- start:2877 stop:3956 length:1080 start_codon:yes stop_codon:yes gene_type:complete